MSHDPADFTLASETATAPEQGQVGVVGSGDSFGLRVNANDIWMTPDHIAADMVHHFRPSGKLLEPCRGDGAFARAMPGAEWCEVRDGRDFFDWREPVDWIVSNPPYSIFTRFQSHAMSVAENVVWLIPLHKPFGSWPRMEELFRWGGIREIRVYGRSRDYGLDVGFVCGAVHYQRGYTGPTAWSFFSGPNIRSQPHAEDKA